MSHTPSSELVAPTGDDTTNPHLCWPAERFYWSVLDAPGFRGRGPLPIGLRDQFEEDLPVPGEGVHAVAAGLGDGRVVVCAAPRSALAALDGATLSLTPERLPDCNKASGAEPFDPASLNLLTGEFEPRALKRVRARRHMLTAASLLLCAGLLSLGLLRRAEHWRDSARTDTAAADAILASTGGNILALQRELDRLRHATSTASPDAGNARDAAPALAAILGGWPAGVPSKPVSIRVDPQGASIEVNTEGDPTAFLSAIKLPPGWKLQEPRLNTAGSLTRLSLSLRPEAAP